MTVHAGESSLHARLQVALHALDGALPEAGWNHSEVADLLDPAIVLTEAAVLVGLVPRASGVNVLLTRRTERLRHHAGQVSFPGGRVERSDRDVIEAALREASEEIRLSTAEAMPIGLLDPLVTITGFRVVPVVVWIDPGFVPVPDPDEVAEVFEVPLATLLDPAQLVEQPIEYMGRTRHVLEFAHRPQRIWGASASILLNLRRRLEAVP